MQINDFFKFTTYCKLGNQAGLNVKWFKVTATGGAGLSDLALAQGLSAQLSITLKPLLTSAASYVGATLAQPSQDPQPDTIAVTSGAGPGTAGNDPLPSNVCGIFTLTTGLAGKSNRGRVYVPFPDESDNDMPPAGQPEPTAGYMTRLGLHAANFTNPQVITSGANSVTVLPFLVGANFLVRQSFTGATARQKWATQHRRGSYGQANNFSIF